MEKTAVTTDPFLVLRGIVKEFPGVRALSDITFDVFRGEVHCVVGENGAGKSTLMKILSGAYAPTSGCISIDGREYGELTPAMARELGISIVYQENDLVPTMNAVENIFVGNEIAGRAGFVDFKAMLRRVRSVMEHYSIHIDPLQTIEHMSVADQQFVKILKALMMSESRVLILDEPTSMFNVEDAEKVLTITKNIADRKIGVVYISHYLKEVVRIADRITVIRDGVAVCTFDNADRDVPVGRIAAEMVGRPVDVFYKKESNPIGDVMLEVKDLRLHGDAKPVSFFVRKGEILGLSGMVGSGRTEIARAVSGADPRFSGDIYLNGQKLEIRTPADSIRAGIAHITEDRQRLGLNLSSSVLENTLIIALQQPKGGFFYNYKRYAAKVRPIVEKLDIRTPSLMQEVRYLSGGNQQKVVLGKWLYTRQSVYIFDEPTRGIDVNAKAEFYRQMTALTREGNAIIMISSDMPELISMSDRVLVIRKGSIRCELTGKEINEQRIIKEALGVN
ncbi:MAG: sugar ABC transporter ATP-binding protein [Clostridiales bacterium]|nr:sugar ABC transporter ATP-binding protein [Clostridiales bacterium]